MPRATWFLVATVALVSALLYTTRLGFAPAYLMHDESQFALQAASIASSGRDLAGRFLPIFFTEPEFPAGRDPASIYLTAAALVWLPVSEASVRWPTAMLGVLNIVLMFVLARRLFGRDWMAVAAAVLLALTPAHFIRSRLLLSPQSSIPIILAWLLCMAAFSDRPGPRRLALAAAWLGLGLYTYLACVVMMPLYLVLTVIVGYRELGPRAVAIALVAFAVPVVPMAIWYLTHPERITQVVGAYELANNAASASPSVSSALAVVRTKLGLYWTFFSPEYLFVSGDASLINSTRLTGLFPLSFAALMPLGVWHVVRTRREMGLVILAGLLTAPIAAVASGAIEMNRVLFVIPFGVLIAMFGVEWLVAKRAPAWRALAIALMVAVPWQFAGFYQDYMGRYRIAAAATFGGNTREILTTAIGRAGSAREPVYVSQAIPFADRYWRFYALAQGRPDVIPRLARYGAELPTGVAPATLLVCSIVEPECWRLLTADGDWRELHIASEPDGTPSFALFERQ